MLEAFASPEKSGASVASCKPARDNGRIRIVAMAFTLVAQQGTLVGAEKRETIVRWATAANAP